MATKEKMAELKSMIEDNLKNGLITSYVENGETYYALTEIGEAYIQAMPFENEEEEREWVEEHKRKEQ